MGSPPRLSAVGDVLSLFCQDHFFEEAQDARGLPSALLLWECYVCSLPPCLPAPASPSAWIRPAQERRGAGQRDEPCVRGWMGQRGAGGTFCGVQSITWSPGCHAGRSGCLQMLPGDADGDVSSVRKSTNHLGITDHGQGSAFCSWGKMLALMRTPRKTLIYTRTSWWI